MKLSCLVTLFLTVLGATSLQIVNAQVCPSDTLECNSKRSMQMCVKRNGHMIDRCVRKRQNVLRRIIRRGGSCGPCDFGGWGGGNGGEVGISETCEKQENKCNNGAGVRMCRRKSTNEFYNKVCIVDEYCSAFLFVYQYIPCPIVIFWSYTFIWLSLRLFCDFEQCIRKDRVSFIEHKDGHCGRCEDTIPTTNPCSASADAERCENANGVQGYFMVSENTTVCVKDTLTPARQVEGDKCGCNRGVCPRTCPYSDNCDSGKGSSMCMDQSNYGKMTICVNKAAVTTNLDQGLGRCGICWYDSVTYQHHCASNKLMKNIWTKVNTWWMEGNHVIFHEAPIKDNAFCDFSFFIFRHARRCPTPSNLPSQARSHTPFLSWKGY